MCNRGITARAVTAALRAHDVDAMAVEGGIRGWVGALQARPVDLGVDGLAVVQVQRPGRGCLSYVVAAGAQALVVDPAPDAAFYVELAAELDATITDVVDTHLHADHLSGARALADATGATLRLPAPALARGVAYPERVQPLHDGDPLAIGGVSIRAIALPGHTTDMTGLLLADRALVGGDSLFADGIARPDLQRGDPEGARAMARTLHATLHERVLTLGDDVVLLPGHTHPGVHADRRRADAVGRAGVGARAGDRRRRRVRRGPAGGHAAAAGELRDGHRRQRRHPPLRPRARDGRQQLLDPLSARATRRPTPWSSPAPSRWSSRR